ncbi:MAG: DNA-3-methyladenine glycosylase 2 family protein [Myxococcota bacterium]
MHTVTASLTPVAPFDFSHTLHFLGRFAPTRGEQRTERRLTKLMALHGQPVLFEVSARGTPEAPALDCTLHAHHPLDEQARALAVDRIGFSLSVGDDLRPFYRRARTDPAFFPLVRRWHGFHQPKFFSPFENAAWAVLTQRTPMTLARRLKCTLMERLGVRWQHEGVEHLGFPEPATVAAVSVEELTAILGHRRKAAWIHGLAQAFSNVDDAFLRHGHVHHVLEWLRALPGLGPWSSAFVAIRGLGRMEWLDVKEARLLSAASLVYGRTLELAEARRLAEAYAEHRGYWALYLRASEPELASRPGMEM